MYSYLEAKKDCDIIFDNITESGVIKVHQSLSDIENIYKKIEEKNDIPRIAFNIMAVSMFYENNQINNLNQKKINKVINFIYLNKEKGDKDSLFFINLYLLRSLIYLKKSKEEINRQLNFFLVTIKDIKNKYNKPLLANKLISFYEEYRYIYDLSSLDTLILNLKSVMLYLISSDLAKESEFFYFADMLCWSRGQIYESKVLFFLENNLEKKGIYNVSSSAIAYILECKLRAGYTFDKKMYTKIQKSLVSDKKFYETFKKVKQGLYLNRPGESYICLDTNAHLLIGFLYSKT
ncbi:MAG: hypothetical protein KBC41_02735 [Candidatus Pacebacteria bacterium]|nr:hypothetical protein [Candidatus Paceibacterota bacterium]